MNRPASAILAAATTWHDMTRKPRAWVKKYRKAFIADYHENRES